MREMTTTSTARAGRAIRATRIALGVVFVVRTTPLVNVLPIPLARVHGPLYGWPADGWPFAWADAVLPAWTQGALAIVRTLAALLFVAGVRARVAGVVAGACGVVALSQDPFGFIFTLYTLFMGTIVVALAEGAREGTRLLRAFVASIYAWSALAKLHTEWLSGETLRALAEDHLVSPLARATLAAYAWAPAAAAWSVIFAELALPVALLVPRTRRAAFVAALLFHAVLELAAHPDVMGAVMASLLLCFVA